MKTYNRAKGERMMQALERFVDYLCGDFSNEEQIEHEAEKGNIIHPKARHINRVCHSKIKGLPEDFKGYFIIEESYYEIGNRHNSLPHLFLFELNEEGKVRLTAYELPEGIKKEDFRNDNPELIMQYDELKVSEKFTPMVYEEKEGVFEGESVSDFGNGLSFTLKESTSKEALHVSEVFEKNGKITFGFKDPIIYKKIRKE